MSAEETTTTEETTADAGSEPEGAAPDAAADPAGDAGVDGGAGDGAAEPGAEPAKAEPEKPKEKDTELFRAALKARDQATEKLQEASRLEERAKAKETEAERLRGDLEKQRAEIEAIKADPFKYFELFGMDPNDFARRLMEYNEVPPQQRARDRELEDIKRKLAERDERDRQMEAQRRAAEMADLEGKVKAGFVEYVEKEWDNYPDIAVDDPEATSAEFLRLAQTHYDNTRIWPSFEMVAAHMQNAAAARNAKRQERSKQRGTGKSSETTTPRVNGQAATSPGPRSPTPTLTQAATTQRASPPREFKSEAELNEWAAEELRRAMEGAA